MSDNPAGYTIRAVRSFNERCQALHLVYRKYLESGFILPNSSGLFFSLLDLLPQSSCWIATHNNRVVGTMSIVTNTTAGLPGGAPYEDDLNHWGVEGRLVGEITKLAVEDHFRSANLASDLMATVICVALQNGMDDVFCVVHPRHALAWCRMFGWRSLGEVKSHSGVNNKPGILLQLDLTKMPSNFSGLPLRGQKLLFNAQERVATEKSHFRPSGCETATLLSQGLTHFKDGCKAQRKGIERHYPWATELLTRIVQRPLRIGFSNQPSLPKRPGRDRSVPFPNEASRQKMLAGDSIQRLVDWDQLLFPDAPIAFLLEDKKDRRNYIYKTLEESGLIVVRRDREQSVIDVLQKHISDLILTTLPSTHPELEQVVEFIRKRDALLDLHTPIINVNDVFGHRNASERLGNDHVSKAMLATLQEFSNILRMITTSFGASEDDESAALEESDTTSERKHAVNA